MSEVYGAEYGDIEQWYVLGIPVAWLCQFIL